MVSRYQELLRIGVTGDKEAKSVGDLLLLEIARRRQEFIDELTKLIGRGPSGQPLGERVFTLSHSYTMSARAKLLALFLEIKTMLLSTQGLRSKYKVREKEVEEEWENIILTGSMEEVLRIWSVIDRFLYDKGIIKVDNRYRIDSLNIEAENTFKYGV